MKHWQLNNLPEPTVKRTPREQGTDAPRVSSAGTRAARVLFSTPECRAVVLELAADETLGDHQVHERAVIQVVAGEIDMTTAEGTLRCATGDLMLFEPRESHSVYAESPARILVLFAPWPSPDRHADSLRPDHVPANATIPPEEER